MTVRLFAMTCGWMTMPLRAFLDGQDGEIRLPVPCYLIKHSKGMVLFDSGLIPTCNNPKASETNSLPAASAQNSSPVRN